VNETWVHIGILATVLVPIIMIWLDLRKQSRKNGDRLVSIETKLEPIWDWWKGRVK